MSQSTSPQTPPTQTSPPPTGRIRVRIRLLAVGAAVAATIVVWIGASVAGVPLTVSSPAAGAIEITAPLAIASTLVLALAAWAVLAVLERRAPRPRAAWTVVSVAVLALSLPPLALLDAPVETKVALACMHIATGIAVIVIMRSTAAPRRTRVSTG